MKFLFILISFVLIAGCGEEVKPPVTPEPAWPPGQDLKALSSQDRHEMLYLFKALSDFETVSARLLEVDENATSPLSVSSDRSPGSSDRPPGSSEPPPGSIGDDGVDEPRVQEVPRDYQGDKENIFSHLFSGLCERTKNEGAERSFKTFGADCDLHWVNTHNYVEEKKVEQTTGTLTIQSDYLVGDDFALEYGINDFKNDGEGTFSLTANPDFSFTFEGKGESTGEGRFYGRDFKFVRKVRGENSRVVEDRDSDGEPTFFSESHLEVREFEIFLEGEKKGHIAIEETWDGILARELKVAFNGEEIDEDWHNGVWDYNTLLTAIYALEIPLQFPELPEPNQ